MYGNIIDLFCGGGGASEGIRAALGRSPDIVVDFDADVLDVHRTNHPESIHVLSDLSEADPIRILEKYGLSGRHTGLIWASPPCTQFSRARGKADIDASVRDLSWIVERWVRELSPNALIMENVPQFQE